MRGATEFRRGERSERGASALRSLFAEVDWTFSYCAFLLYVFVIVTYRVPVGDVAMAAAIAGLVLQDRKIRIPAFLWWFAGFLLWGLLGYLGTAYPGEVMEGLLLLGRLWLIAFVTVNVLRTPAQVRFFLVFFLVCFATHPARGAIFNYFGGYRIFGRAVWNYIFENPNDMAALTFFPLGVAGALLVTDRNRWVRWGSAASLIVLPLVILMTQSRGAVLALLLVGTLVLFQERRRARNIVVVLLLALGVSLAAPGGVWERMEDVVEIVETRSFETADDMSSAEQRFTIWQVAGSIIRAQPTAGVGLGAYDEEHSSVATSNTRFTLARGERDAHSTYLKVLAETGAVGFFLFGGMVISVFLLVRRTRRRLETSLPRWSKGLWVLELSLLAYLIAGLFGSFDKLSFLYLHLATLVVVADVLQRAVPNRRSGPAGFPRSAATRLRGEKGGLRPEPGSSRPPGRRPPVPRPPQARRRPGTDPY